MGQTVRECVVGSVLLDSGVEAVVWPAIDHMAEASTRSFEDSFVHSSWEEVEEVFEAVSSACPWA